MIDSKENFGWVEFDPVTPIAWTEKERFPVLSQTTIVTSSLFTNHRALELVTRYLVHLLLIIVEVTEHPRLTNHFISCDHLWFRLCSNMLFTFIMVSFLCLQCCSYS